MSKIRLFVFSCLVFVVLALGRGVRAQEAAVSSTDQYGCRQVQVQCIKAPCPVQTICTEPPIGTLSCSWCGLGCVDSSLKMACAMIAPPAGKSCLNVGGKCTIVATPDRPCGSNDDCGPNAYCYQPPMPSCPPGTMCKLMMPSRVCRSCIPRPTCMDGVKDATGKIVYCDPKPGMVYCPITRTIPTPTPVTSCTTDADCGTKGYCYQPPMPVCPPGAACKMMMPRPYCKACTPRLPCMDANPACAVDMLPGAAPFCPRPTTPCGFCGSNCTRLDPRMDCAAGGPISGMKCVDVGGKCTIQKGTAGLGQFCGGISGIMCETGLRCDYGIERYQQGTSTDPQAKIIADKGGICVRDTLKCEWCGTGCRATSAMAGVCPMIAPPSDKVCVPENGACVIKPRNPTCIPRPPCMDGIKDANGNMVYCDPRPGTVYCTSNKAGDANGDGKVDLVDFAYWKKEYISKLIAKADFNKDGKVDLVDFSIWKNNYLHLLTTPWVKPTLGITPTTHTISPTPTYIMPTVTTGNGKADLIVANFVSESSISPGMYSVKTVIGNQGKAVVNIPSGYKVNLYVDPAGNPNSKDTAVTSSSTIYNVLEVGATATVGTFDVNLTLGEHFFYSIIDADNNVVEENDNNNISYVRYWVKETCDWCGSRCTKVTNACPLIPGPAGKSCVTENNSCIIRDN